MVMVSRDIEFHAIVFRAMVFRVIVFHVMASICRAICFPCCSFTVELFREIPFHTNVLCAIVCHVRVIFHVVVILIPYDCVPFYSIPYSVL